MSTDILATAVVASQTRHDHLLAELKVAIERIERNGPKSAPDAVELFRKFVPSGVIEFSKPPNVDAFALKLIQAVDKKAWYAMTLLIRDKAEYLPAEGA